MFSQLKRCVKMNIVTYDEHNFRKMLHKYIQRGYHFFLVRNKVVLLYNTDHNTIEWWVQLFAPKDMEPKQIISAINDEQLYRVKVNHETIELI